MGGIFGGLLVLVDFVGGVILYVLIGRNAWRDSRSGNTYRLLVGALTTGLLLGAVAWVSPLWPAFVPEHEDTRLLFLLLVGAAVSLVVVFILRAITDELSKD